MPPQPTHDPGGYLSLVSDLIPLYVRPVHVHRYHWNEADHPREPAGRSEGGQFTDRGQSPGGQTSTGGQSPPGSGTVPARRPTPGGTALPTSGPATTSPATTGPPTTAPATKGTRKRELAALPDTIVAGHPLHISALDPDRASRITQWSGQLNQIMADVERASDSDAEESAWARVDKDQIRGLLDQMNQWDRQFGQSSGRRLSDFVNAGGLIPRSLAVRLDSGSRFFDPEKLRRHLRTAQPAAEQSAAAQPAAAPQADNATTAEKAKRPRKPRQAKPPGETPPRKVDRRRPFQGLTAVQFNKLRDAIAEYIGSDSPEHQSALEHMVPEAWREMNRDAEDWNQGMRDIVRNFRGKSGLGGMVSKSRRASDADKIKGFDKLVDYAEKEYPHIAAGLDGSESGLLEAIKDGLKTIHAIDSGEVIDRAIDMLGPGFRQSLDQLRREQRDLETSSADSTADPVPFSVRAMMAWLERNHSLKLRMN